MDLLCPCQQVLVQRESWPWQVFQGDVSNFLGGWYLSVPWLTNLCYNLKSWDLPLFVHMNPTWVCLQMLERQKMFPIYPKKHWLRAYPAHSFHLQKFIKWSAGTNAVKTRMRKAQKEIERPKCPSIFILLYNHNPIHNVRLHDAACLWIPAGKSVWPASALAVTLSRKSLQCSLKLEPTPQNVAPRDRHN